MKEWTKGFASLLLNEWTLWAWRWVKMWTKWNRWTQQEAKQGEGTTGTRLTVYSRIILWVQPPVKVRPTFPFPHILLLISPPGMGFVPHRFTHFPTSPTLYLRVLCVSVSSRWFTSLIINCGRMKWNHRRVKWWVSFSLSFVSPLTHETLTERNEV